MTLLGKKKRNRKRKLPRSPEILIIIREETKLRNQKEKGGSYGNNFQENQCEKVSGSSRGAGKDRTAPAATRQRKDPRRIGLRRSGFTGFRKCDNVTEYDSESDIIRA